MSEFRQRCKETAKRFLQTVVIVDDEAYIGQPDQPRGDLVAPTRGTLTHTTTAEVTEGKVGRDEISSHSLDAGKLVETFSRQGLICAVVAPRLDTDPCDIVDPSVKRTDIVILDWRLNGDDGETTLSILKNILKVDAGERLRLIAIYTGEQEISRIGRTLVEKLAESEWMFEGDEHHVVLSYQHCRIVIYSKSDLPGESDLSDRSLSESDLPEALIGDFAAMTEGLLPSIALMSLSAIRENAHKVLDRFDAKLDPALLTQRACLPVPDDSQQQMVSQLASELHAIMDVAVATGEPAGMEAIKEWLDTTLGAGEDTQFGEGKVASRDETITLLREGWEKGRPDCLSKGQGFGYLTAGFSKGDCTDHSLDRQFAWMFNFRTIYNAPPPVLQLGTVLRKTNDLNASYFLCMRPKCDSVRLSGKTIFLFWPLIESDENPIQIVLRTDKDTYRRFGACTKMDHRWLLVPFEPIQDGKPIVAKSDDPSNDPLFYFTDADGRRYDWIGELKAEFAQHMVHEFASRLSRVAVTDTELLRRGVKL